MINWDEKGELKEVYVKHGIYFENKFYADDSEKQRELLTIIGLEPKYKGTLLGIVSEIYCNEKEVK